MVGNNHDLQFIIVSRRCGIFGQIFEGHLHRERVMGMLSTS